MIWVLNVQSKRKKCEITWLRPFFKWDLTWETKNTWGSHHEHLDNSSPFTRDNVLLFARNTWDFLSTLNTLKYTKVIYLQIFSTHSRARVNSHPRLNFTSGVVIHHFVVMKLIHDVSLYKMIVPDLVRVTENDKKILLQNADWFLSSSYSKGAFCHYKMTIGFYHEDTWGCLRGIPSHYKMTIGIHWFLTCCFPITLCF